MQADDLDDLDEDWSDEPPEQLMPFLEILRVPAEGEVRGKILSDAVLGVKTHYLNRRTIAHMNDKRRCDGCKLKWPVRWRGYVYALGADGKAFIAEITFMGFKGCKAFVTYKGDLQGRELRQVRRGTGANGMQLCTVSQEKTTFANRFGLPDLKDMLRHIWNGDAEEGDTPNEHGG